MDEQSLRKRKKQFERQRDAELRRCLIRWRRRINSLDLLVRAAAAVKPVAKPRQAAPATGFAKVLEGKRNGERKASVIEVIRQTLRRRHGFFTSTALVELINRTKRFSVTERHVRPPLCSLRKLGEIKLVEKGKGGKPHVYFKL